MKIKTLHLTNYWHERSGGIATFYRHLLDAAFRSERLMALVVPGPCDEVRRIGPHCTVYQIAASHSMFNCEYRTIYPRDYLLPGSKIQRILIRERPDLIEICDKYSLLYLAPLLRHRLLEGLNFRPVVTALSCERMDENFAAYVSRSGWGRAFCRWYMRNLYFKFFDHHVAVSENTADEWRAVSDGDCVERGVWVRHLGVDTEVFSRAKRSSYLRRTLVDRCQASPNAVLLLYAGRVVPEKNLELLLATMEALAKQPQDFRLLIVGDGIAREAMRRDAEKRVPGKICFIGHIGDREQLSRIYASCDFFLHPNPHEPYGIAPLEAMASGLPLIAPNCGGVASYANEQNAYPVAPTAEAFASAVLNGLRDETGRSKRAIAARATAESLSWPSVTQSYLSLYETLHAVATGRKSIQEAAPAFCSTKATAAQARRIEIAASWAKKGFSSYAAAHSLWRRIRPQVEAPLYQPELEATRPK